MLRTHHILDSASWKQWTLNIVHRKMFRATHILLGYWGWKSFRWMTSVGLLLLCFYYPFMYTTVKLIENRGTVPICVSCVPCWMLICAVFTLNISQSQLNLNVTQSKCKVVAENKRNRWWFIISLSLVFFEFFFSRSWHLDQNASPSFFYNWYKYFITNAPVSMPDSTLIGL